MSSLEAERCHCQDIEEIDASRDRISSLPNDLLIHILLFVSTKDAVSTTILSKRWRFIWTMVPKLEFKYTKYESLGRLLELHKSPVLESLIIHQIQKTSIEVEELITGIDVEELITNSVNRFVRKIEFELLWTTEPTTLTKSLYTCKTLVELRLSNKILVDVPSSVCLPSLKKLQLMLVEFKEEDSLKNLLSSCSALSRSGVVLYINYRWRNQPVMDKITICLSNVPSILVLCNTGDKCLRVSSLVTNLHLSLIDPMVLHFSGIVFPKLQLFRLRPFGYLWLDLLRMMLNNSPNLRDLRIDSVSEYTPELIPFQWIQPNVVPRCLSSHLQEFRWYGYRGKEQEKQVMRYILANSKCLQIVKIKLVSSTLGPEEKEMIIEDLKSMSRVSTFKLFCLNE